MKTRFLWIEDGAISDYQKMLGPIYVSGQYDPKIVLNVTDGLENIKAVEFQAVIVDIRLPPGSNSAWASLYNESKQNQPTARLGLELLRLLLRPSPDSKIIKPRDIPSWVTPDRFGVLTVESENEVKDELNKLGIKVYRQKTAGAKNTILLDIVKQILTNKLE